MKFTDVQCSVEVCSVVDLVSCLLCLWYPVLQCMIAHNSVICLGWILMCSDVLDIDVLDIDVLDIDVLDIDV